MALRKLKKTFLVTALLLSGAHGVEAQGTRVLDSLVTTALGRNPALDAARARVQGARARIGPAGTLPDPMVGAGVMNLPVNASGYNDMTMNAIMVSQTVPYPGRLRLQREVAAAELAIEEAMLAAVARDVERDVRRAYFDVAFADRAMALLAQSQSVTIGLSQSAESRYAVGAATQQEVLRFQVEAASAAKEAAMVAEQRRAAVARLNSILAVTDPVTVTATIPEHIRAAAVAPDAARIRFVSGELGARAADSPLPALPVVQQRALAGNPELRAADARIAMQTARVRLAEQAHLPDFDVELQYGQRPSRPDMISLMVSVPLPVRRAARQQQDVVAARSELSALQSDRASRILSLNAEIAELYTDLEAIRAQLALYVRSILPQGRAAFESAATGYVAGKTDFVTVLEQRATVFEFELAYERALADFARKLSELERVVGAEVIS